VVATEGTDRRRYWTLGVLCISLILVGMSVTILNVAIPSLVRALHAKPDELQWIFAAYGIVFSGLVITMGAISDRVGRKRLLDIGLVVFGVASGLGAFATTPGPLIAARAAMGFGAAMIMPGTLSILTTVFPSPAEQQQAIGIWSGVGGLGFILGPPVAGILLSHFWWGSVLLANVPIVIVALLLGVRLVPESRDPDRVHLDLVGAALSTVTISSLVFAFIQAPDSGWTSGPVLAAFVGAVVAGTGFVWWELTREHPMLDVRLFRGATFTIPALAITFGFFTVWGLLFLLPQYLQFVRGDSVLTVGLTLALISVTWSLSAPLIPRLLVRIGDRAGMTAALVVAALGALCFVGVAGGRSVLFVVLGLMVLGLGMGAVTTPATALLVSGLPPEQAGVGSAMNDVTREFGSAFGIAVLGSVLALRYSAQVAVAGLSASTARAARNGIGGALQIARTMHPVAARALRVSADAAFTSGFRLAVVVGALVLAGLAALTWAKLPRTAGAGATSLPDPAGQPTG
jgi:MFS transporter, DHA2 family, multidrug resistance protein